MFEDNTKTYLRELAGLALNDEALWLEALTHGSTGNARTYERLEFLGDRVLGLVIAEWLHALGTGNEGKLSQRLNALVSRTMCAGIARKLGLGAYIRLGKQASDDGARDSDNVLGDVMEALIGACFVTEGYDAARAMVRRLWAEAVTGHVGSAKHPKSELQEWAAMNKRKVPQYRILDRSGPDHAARFTVEVSVSGLGEARGHGSSKQDAETAAAAAFIETHT
ncbi:MAG: ribonuclease III [Novosphingobium sp.]